MAELDLVEKRSERNHSPENLEIWVMKNMLGILQYEPEISALTNGWFSFKFNSVEDADKILKKHWSYRFIPILLNKWMPLLDVDCEKLDTIMVWVCLLGLPWEF